jgi:hypothetical protein
VLPVHKEFKEQSGLMGQPEQQDLLVRKEIKESREQLVRLDLRALLA